MSTSAPIYSTTGEGRAHADSAAWARFSSTADSNEFCQAWLTILCGQLERVSGALLLLRGEQEGSYAAAVVWPHAGSDMRHLGPAAQRALTERRGLVMAPDGSSPPGRDQPAYVAYPVEVGDTLYGAVVLDLPPGAEPALQQALRTVHWGIAWLIDQFRRQVLAERDARLADLALGTDLIATTLQERRFAPSALAAVNALAGHLECERVSLGMERAGCIDVLAISHTANFDRKSNLVRLIGEAMEEVLDLDVAVVYPVPEDDELGAVAHAELAREVKSAAICSVPLVEGNHALGVLTLERAAPGRFDEREIALCKTVGLLLGPILALKRENERSAWQRLRDGTGAGARALFGPRHPGVKLIALLAVALVVFFSVATGEYRVAAKTVIEGEVQRAAVAPFDGYIAEGPVRAGDTVKKGQVLARLDDRDLKLEETRWRSEREQLERKHRKALATQDRSAMAVLEAQINQSEAQLALTEEKLARETLVAPFDGIVVSGDLSQRLGAPVEQGKLLFEIAPLDAYRVILQVDERDITQLKIGQHGELALSGLPHERMSFVIKQIAPVSTPEEGRNTFRVEAQLEKPSPRLRPGMEGVGKVDIGERRLIWISTHNLFDWLRLAAWNWLP
jgi:RND family efflux transporter MFP subunit